MKLGIKVGLKSDWKNDLITTQPDFCEIWFDSRKIPEYEELFAFTQKRGIATGIHFWGALPDNTLANLAYPDKEILNESRDLVKKTIEIAGKNKSIYVNLHPAGKLLTRVDFDKEEFEVYTKETPQNTVLTNLKESLKLISEYAKNLGVPVCLESVPLRALGHPWTGAAGRKKPIGIGEFIVNEIEPFLNIDNLYFANDFGHTAGNIVSNDRNLVIDQVFNITKRLAPRTKLLHVSYIIPPYNGTDYHGCLYYDEFSTSQAVPNRDEMKQLLKLFIERDDVGALVEPEKDHIKNFFTLKKLVSEVA